MALITAVPGYGGILQLKISIYLANITGADLTIRPFLFESKLILKNCFTIRIFSYTCGLIAAHWNRLKTIDSFTGLKLGKHFFDYVVNNATDILIENPLIITKLSRDGD